jgi:DNA replication and repair protein RecF
VKFTYESDLNSLDFATALNESVDKDLTLERTSIGIHKDDIEFEIDGFPLKKFGSQGQSKSFIMAFKLAQYKYISETLGTQPILLMDDMFEKIDEVRAQKLIDKLCSGEFGQIILTDTHLERVRKHFENVNKSINFVEL